MSCECLAPSPQSRCVLDLFLILGRCTPLSTAALSPTDLFTSHTEHLTHLARASRFLLPTSSVAVVTSFSSLIQIGFSICSLHRNEF